MKFKKHQLNDKLSNATYSTRDFCYLLNSGKHEELLQKMHALQDVLFEVAQAIVWKKKKPMMYSELMNYDK